MSHKKPHSEIAEAYRALRTSVLLSSAPHPPKTILISSPIPQDGKTTTSLNLAIVLAQQGKRILLVDADMRRPGIHLVFGLKDKLGLSNILTGGSKISEVLHSTVQPNLFVIPAGPVPPQPSELLSSSAMQDLLLKWREEFDHIIVDSPPIISVTDAVLLSTQMDAMLLVIRSGQTTTAHVRRACNLLQGVNAGVLGIVVNAADRESPYYYHYYYGYKKYHSYTEKEETERNGEINGDQDLNEIADQRKGEDALPSRHNKV